MLSKWCLRTSSSIKFFFFDVKSNNLKFPDLVLSAEPFSDRRRKQQFSLERHFPLMILVFQGINLNVSGNDQYRNKRNSVSEDERNPYCCPVLVDGHPSHCQESTAQLL